MSADIASDLPAKAPVDNFENIEVPSLKFDTTGIQPIPHHIVLTIGRFLEYTRPPFSDEEFLEVADRIGSAANPDDAARSEAFHMGEYNRLLKTLTDYVQLNSPVS